MVRREGFDEALRIALLHLRSSERFEAEVLARLLDKGVSREAADSVLDHLRSKGLVSDQRAIEAWLHRRSGKRAAGSTLLRAELVARGAPEDIVDRCLAGTVDEAATASQLVAERFGPRFDRGKAARFLASRGFDEEAIRQAIGEPDWEG